MTPIATSDTYSISIFELPLTVDVESGVLSNDSDPGGSELISVLAQPSQNGIVNLNPDGSFSYIPNSSFLGVDSFTYTVLNGAGMSDTAEVTIEVNLLAEPPDTAILGTDESELLRGDSGPDYLFGAGGHDTLIGRSGSDTIGGGDGNDLAFARMGDDLLDGGNGRDTLDGGRDSDVLFGGAGRDLLKGQRGDDLLLGGEGNDRMLGHHGNDTLAGGEGDDTLRGGRGADVFVLSPGSGIDVIGDFKFNEDLIALTDGLTFEALSFEVLGEITTISANDELLAMVHLEGDGSLESESNFVVF